MNPSGDAAEMLLQVYEAASRSVGLQKESNELSRLFRGAAATGRRTAFVPASANGHCSKKQKIAAEGDVGGFRFGF